MTTGPVEEQLSAWLDDELPPAELELLAARVVREPAQQSRLARYALIGSLLRENGVAGPVAASRAAFGLAARVQVALDGSAAPQQSGTDDRQPAHGSFRLLPAAAVAGLGLAVVVLVSVLRPTGPVDGALVAGNQTAVSVQSAALTSAVAGPRAAAALSPGDGRASLSSRRLTNYLIYHGEYSGGLSTRVTDSHIVNQRPYATAVNATERVPVR